MSGPEAPARPARWVVLVGMMGAGKTAVGAALAAMLGWKNVDTDELVEKSEGKSVQEIFASRGEQTFRALEERAISSLAGWSEPLVVSVGGGAVLSAANREALRRLGAVVWLRALPATLATRVGAGEGRPVLGAGATLERLVELCEQRRPYYEEVADLVIDSDELSPEQVASAIAHELRLGSFR